MQGESHVIVSVVKTDFDGVWRDDAKEFQKEIESLGVILIMQPLKGKRGVLKATLIFLSRQLRQH